MPPQYLILFDIDGTLLRADGAGREAMRAALTRVYGTAGTIDDHAFGGRTDRELVASLLSEAGVPGDRIDAGFEDFSSAMAEELAERLACGEHHVEPCAGAPALVDALSQRSDTLVGLLTGNLESTSHLKLKAAGYPLHAFRVGAFGGELADRADLFRMAVERASQLSGVPYLAERAVVIGDTPADVACGKPHGARAITVLTGGHPRGALEAAGPYAIFDDLADLPRVMAAIYAPPQAAG